MKCIVCNFEITQHEAMVCPNCNSDLTLIYTIQTLGARIKKHRFFYVVSLVLLVVCFLILFFTLCLSHGVKNDSENAIKGIQSENALLKQQNDSLKLLLLDIPQPASGDTDAVAVASLKAQDTIFYIVKKNDNLWTIAEQFFGDGHKFRHLARVNKINKPYDILIGRKLTIVNE